MNRCVGSRYCCAGDSHGQGLGMTGVGGIPVRSDKGSVPAGFGPPGRSFPAGALNPKAIVLAQASPIRNATATNSPKRSVKCRTILPDERCSPLPACNNLNLMLMLLLKISIYWAVCDAEKICHSEERSRVVTEGNACGRISSRAVRYGKVYINIEYVWMYNVNRCIRKHSCSAGDCHVAALLAMTGL